MKNVIVILGFIMSINMAHAQIQPEFGTFDPYEALSEEEKKSGKAQMISQNALNYYFNKQISRQLSGKEDLIMNKSYFTLNDADGEMSFGGSITSKKTKKDFVPFLFQTGVRIKSKEKFGEIFNFEDKAAKSIGFYLKGTLLSRGVMSFGGGDIQRQEAFLGGTTESINTKITQSQNYERYLTSKFKAEYKKEIDKITNDVDALVNQLGLTSAEKDAIFESRAKSLKAEKELEYLIEVEKYITTEELFISSHKSWLSFDMFLAVTPTEYLTAPDFTTVTFDTLELRPHTINITGAYLYTRKSGLTFFVSGGPSLKWQNTITRDGVEKSSFLKFVERDATNPDIELTQTHKDDIYVGDFKSSILTPSVNFKATAMLGGRFSFVGLSTALEYRLSPGDNIWFWKWGIPFNLKGKDDDTKVNIEPQIRWNTNKKNAIIGLSVGVPFGTPLF